MHGQAKVWLTSKRLTPSDWGLSRETMSDKSTNITIGIRHLDDQPRSYGEAGEDVPVCLLDADRRQHLYCVGKTGTGKSSLLLNLIAQDLEAGRGV